MLVLLAHVDLRILGCRSLKEKRHVVKTLTGALRSRFEVSVAEVGSHDLWQRAELGIAVVAGEAHHARRVLHAIERFVETSPDVEVLSVEVTEHHPEDVA